MMQKMCEMCTVLFPQVMLKHKLAEVENESIVLNMYTEGMIKLQSVVDWMALLTHRIHAVVIIL